MHELYEPAVELPAVRISSSALAKLPTSRASSLRILPASARVIAVNDAYDQVGVPFGHLCCSTTHENACSSIHFKMTVAAPWNLLAGIPTAAKYIQCITAPKIHTTDPYGVERSDAIILASILRREGGHDMRGGHSLSRISELFRYHR